MPTTLELATTEELLAELLQRSTFRGVIVWQVANFRGVHEPAFRWASRNCDTVGVVEEMLPQIREQLHADPGS